MTRFAEDPSNWVVSPPIYFPAIFSHFGTDIGYAVRCQARTAQGRGKPVGPLPLRHLFIDYTQSEDRSDIGLFIESTVRAFRMDDLSVIKSEDNGIHIFQRLFRELPLED